MQSTYEARSGEQTTIQRTLVRGSARLCGDTNFSKVCRALWPHKTAAELAALVGCAVRTAEYEISGERPPSDKSMLVVINKIFAR